VTARVLVVEDEETIGGALCQTLRDQGHTVEWATDGATALQLAADSRFDLVLLDLGLPDVDGLEVCRALRVDTDLSIVVVTARGEEWDVVMGLDAGADDYIVKPFRLAELLARVRANLRHVTDPGRGRIQVGALLIDPAVRRVTVDGTTLQLRPKEFELLTLLVASAGRIVSRAEIIEAVWDGGENANHSIEMHISWLRRKLIDHGLRPDCISTIRGLGYRFDA
jgi:DNA-binding response OmpR family regulator